MSKFKQLVKNKLEDDRGLATAIASKMGYKSPTSLYKFLNEEERELESFDGLLVLVSELFPGEEKETLNEYLPTLDPNKKAARCALEYADVNNFFELRNVILNNLSGSNNKESKEWFEVYSIHSNRDNLDLFDLEDEISDLTIKTPEMKLLSRLTVLYKNLIEGNWGNMDKSLRNINKKGLDKIADSFLSKSYECRLKMLRVNSNLWQGKIEEARKDAHDIIEIDFNQRFQVYSHLHLGNSYMFEDHDKAAKYLLKGLEYSGDDTGYRSQILLSLSFASSYWKKDNPYVKELGNTIIEEYSKVFSLISTGNKSEAANELKRLIQLDLNNDELAYHYFYQGLISNDKGDFLKSVKYFIKTDDKFFRNLPLIELRKLGESDQMLELLTL